MSKKIPNSKKKGDPPHNIKLSTIPEGYALATGPDDKTYMVPIHLIDDLDQAFESYRQKLALGVEQEMPAFVNTNDVPTGHMGDGIVPHPPSPALSDQECLALHGNVLALQQLHGISYMDAAHRLYMTEVAKTKQSHQTLKAFGVVVNGLNKSLHKFDKNFGGEDTDDMEEGGSEAH